MESMLLMIVCIGSGIFCILGAALEWDFFYNNYKAKRMVNMFGKQGAKIFYIILGAVVIGMGIITPFMM